MQSVLSYLRGASKPEPLTLDSLYVYPLKSARGISVQEWEYTPEGLKWDRQFMIADAKSHRFLTARSIHEIVLIETAFDFEAQELILTIPLESGRKEHRVSLAPPTGTGDKDYQIWTSKSVEAHIVENEALTRDLCELTRRDVVLVRKGKKRREAGKPEFVTTYGASWLNELEYRADEDDEDTGDDPYDSHTQVSFADGFPFLLCSQPSLDELNKRLRDMLPRLSSAREGAKAYDAVRWAKDTIDMARFRPNVVVGGGAEPFEEDGWQKVAFGSDESSNEMYIASRCTRCLFPNVDPGTAERDQRVPSHVLQTFRDVDLLNPGATCFGVNMLSRARHGTLKVGDPVHVVTRCERDGQTSWLRFEDQMVKEQ